MKKVIATILAFVYLATSMGATLHLHYCMGKLVSWGLQDHERKNCSFCGMPKKVSTGQAEVEKEGCCKDEHKSISAEKDQKLPQTAFQLFKLLPAVLPVAYPALQDISVSGPAIDLPVAHGPPLLAKVPVFLLHRKIRI